MNVLYYKNTNLVEIVGLTDEVTGAPLTAATVTLTLVHRSSGANVVGQAWPLTLSHVGGGTYRASVLDTITVAPREWLIAKVTANQGGVVGYWEEPLQVIVRTSRERL